MKFVAATVVLGLALLAAGCCCNPCGRGCGFGYGNGNNAGAYPSGVCCQPVGGNPCYY